MSFAKILLLAVGLGADGPEDLRVLLAQVSQVDHGGTAVLVGMVTDGREIHHPSPSL